MYLYIIHHVRRHSHIIILKNTLFSEPEMKVYSPYNMEENSKYHEGQFKIKF